MSGYGDGYDDGWNEAIAELISRFDSAIGALDELAEAKRDKAGSDYDRLRGKLKGMELAKDFARGMVR